MVAGEKRRYGSGYTFEWGERSGEESRVSAETKLKGMPGRPQGASGRRSTKRE
jgi:hypothetical protein